MQPLSARFVAIATAASIASFASAAASALTVTLVTLPGPPQQTTYLQAIIETDEWIDEQHHPQSLPASGSVVATAGSLVEQLVYDLSSTGFVFEASQAADSSAGTATFANLLFQVDEPAQYTVSGSFAATNEAGTYIDLIVYLRETSGVDPELFRSWQESEATANQAFELGGEAGDLFNQKYGAPTGILRPGRTYELTVSTALSQGPAPSTGSGTVVIELPEPASASLMLAGLAELAALARRRAR